MALVKCAWCELREDKTLYIQDQNKKYYHIEACHAAFMQDKEFKKKEREELDLLTDTIVEVHGLKYRASVPHTFFPFLNEIRNDSVLFGKVRKAYKEGISYQLLADTYYYCKDKIAWAKSNKEFKNTIGELRYGLAIVKSNIENTIRYNAKKAKQQASTVKLIESINTMDAVNQRLKEFQQEAITIIDDPDEVNVESLFD